MAATLRGGTDPRPYRTTRGAKVSVVNTKDGAAFIRLQQPGKATVFLSYAVVSALAREAGYVQREA